MIVSLLAAVSPTRGATVTTHSIFGDPDSNGIPVSMDGVPLHSSGTGFYVASQGYFVTAAHVAGNCTDRAVLREDGAQTAALVSIDHQGDVAVLKSTPVSNVPALTLGVGSPRAKSFTIVRTKELGGLPSRQTVLARYIGYVRVANQPAVSFALSAAQPIVGGNSGSPAIVAPGEVAGMISAVSSDDRSIAFVIDGRDIAKVLTAARVPFVWRAPGEAPELLDPMSYTFPIACYRAK